MPSTIVNVLGGVDARTAVLETDSACPEWLWDDDILAPVGETAAEGAEAGEAGAEEAAEARPELCRACKRGRHKGGRGGRKIGKNVPTPQLRLEVQDPACRNRGKAR